MARTPIPFFDAAQTTDQECHPQRGQLGNALFCNIKNAIKRMHHATGRQACPALPGLVEYRFTRSYDLKAMIRAFSRSLPERSPCPTGS